MLRILLLSYSFPPENSPRSFRTMELAREFARTGHEVTVFAPRYTGKDTDSERFDGIDVRRLRTGLFVNAPAKAIEKDRDHGYHKKLGSTDSRVDRLLRYYLIEAKAEYAFSMLRELLRCNRSFDLAISISYPLWVHLAFSLAITLRPKLSSVAVADCGDPYFFHEVIQRAPYHRTLERFALRPFDFVTVPTKSAISAYVAFKAKRSIRVIPQGFRLTEIQRAHYAPHAIPTFGYAGSFQPIVRDPSEFLDYLANREEPFQFHIYMTKPALTMSFLRPYQSRFGERLKIYGTANRQQLLYELSQLDFLIDVGNTTSNQVPSKLIDYTLTRRPIFSYTPGHFSADAFESFCKGEYTNRRQVEISHYDIAEVARKFELLYHEGALRGQ